MLTLFAGFSLCFMSMHVSKNVSNQYRLAVRCLHVPNRGLLFHYYCTNVLLVPAAVHGLLAVLRKPIFVAFAVCTF